MLFRPVELRIGEVVLTAERYEAAVFWVANGRVFLSEGGVGILIGVACSKGFAGLSIDEDATFAPLGEVGRRALCVVKGVLHEGFVVVGGE
jgi:hypothetical protein